MVRGGVLRGLCGISRQLELLGRINGWLLFGDLLRLALPVTQLGEIYIESKTANLKPTELCLNGQNTAHKHWQDIKETR